MEAWRREEDGGGEKVEEGKAWKRGGGKGVEAWRREEDGGGIEGGCRLKVEERKREKEKEKERKKKRKKERKRGTR